MKIRHQEIAQFIPNKDTDDLSEEGYLSSEIFSEERPNSEKKDKHIRRHYFHASPKRFKVGDILDPSYAKNADFFDDKQAIFGSNDAYPHYTISEFAGEESWHIYEITPLEKGTLPKAGGLWDEYQFKTPVVVKKYIGTAAGILNNRKKNWTDKSNGIAKGSAVIQRPYDNRKLESSRNIETN